MSEGPSAGRRLRPRRTLTSAPITVSMPEHFTPAEAATLAPYVTNLDQPVFALRDLPEEVVAVLFAYYSRSRDSLRRNLLKLIRDRDLELLDPRGAAPAA